MTLLSLLDAPEWAERAAQFFHAAWTRSTC